ncbi:MAG: HAD-IIA family hydrolase [Pelistega sp.]|nr:HAD-IIA family hydrolase [Pelistega sp.]
MQLTLSPSDILSIYQQIDLPKATFPSQFQRVHTLADIEEQYDAFFFDAFGVLNLGETAIPLAAERIRHLKAKVKQLCIVSNAASVSRQQLFQKYSKLGFDFSIDEIVSSRDALASYLQTHPAHHYGVTAPIGTKLEDLNGSFVNLIETPSAMDKVEGILLLSSQDWTTELQQQLVQSLLAKPRPLLLGNPDLVAPRDDHFSLEPGFMAKDILDKTDLRAIPFGKPYDNIFNLAKAKLPIDTPLQRVLMVGDTLHTDIFGGCHANIHTAMVSANGFAATIDWQKAIQETGVCPHYVIDFI